MRLPGLFVLFLFVAGSATAQEKEVRFQNGIPSIQYISTSGEKKSDVLKRFANPLPEGEESRDLKADTFLVSVKSALQLQCTTNECVPLYYVAQKGETFKSIGDNLGNVSPYHLKRLNTDIELVEAGDKIRIGFLQGRLFDAVIYENPDSTAPEAEKHNLAGQSVRKMEYTGNRNLEVGEVLYQGGPGAFADGFVHSNKHSKTGQAGNFKTAGGWYDGNYFVLINGVAPGTLVQVKNLKNGNFIIAKVITELPKVRKDEDLLLRISNAGCAALDVWDNQHFEVEVSF